MLEDINVKTLLIMLAALWLITCIWAHGGWILIYVAFHLAVTGVFAWGIHSVIGANTQSDAITTDSPSTPESSDNP